MGERRRSDLGQCQAESYFRTGALVSSELPSTSVYVQDGRRKRGPAWAISSLSEGARVRSARTFRARCIGCGHLSTQAVPQSLQETQTTWRQLCPLGEVMGTHPNWMATLRGVPVHARHAGLPSRRQLPSVPSHATSTGTPYAHPLTLAVASSTPTCASPLSIVTAGLREPTTNAPAVSPPATRTIDRPNKIRRYGLRTHVSSRERLGTGASSPAAQIPAHAAGWSD